MHPQPTKPSTQKDKNAKNGNGIFGGGFSKISVYKNKLNKTWKSDTHTGSVFRNMTKLATGTGIAKLIGFLTAPVITRIYLPEHFGVLSVFVALTALLVPFGTLRYTMAIPLPRHDGAATNLAVLSGILLFCVSVFSFFFFWLLGPAILGVLSMEQLLPYWWLLPLAVAGTGMYELLTNWAVRERAFKPLAKTQVWQQVLGATVKIGLGFLGFKPVGLLIGQIFNQAGGVLSLLRSFSEKFSANIRHVSKKRMQFLILRYADFPKFRLPSQFLMVIATKAPLLYFAWQFGAETAGQFGLAMMVLLLPVNLIGQNTGKAYYGEIAKLGRNNSDEIYKLTKKITINLFKISIVPFITLLVLGPWLFEIIFGDSWREAGVFASILAINLLTMFVANPITNALNVVGKQAYYFQINFIRLFLIIFVFSISYFLEFNPYITLITYSLIISCHRLFVYARIIYIIKNIKKNQ